MHQYAVDIELPMARGKIEVGDEVLVRAEVTGVWGNEHITILKRSTARHVAKPHRHRTGQRCIAKAQETQGRTASLKFMPTKGTLVLHWCFMGALLVKRPPSHDPSQGGGQARRPLASHLGGDGHFCVLVHEPLASALAVFLEVERFCFVPSA